ncbi:MAG: serine/threonine-protein kinase, partial [Candidatus Nanoarchaeia archaeon]
MRFQCSFCFSIINKVKPEQLGQKIDCPNCRRQQVLPVSPFGPGRIIGDFVIIQKIGEGSIGTVYLAKQISLDRNVALKILSEKYTNAKGLASFLSEARTAAKLNHPNIVQVYAVGDEGGICFMAMSYIQGKTVKQRIEEEGKIEVDEALHITQQVAEGLFFAWQEEKLIHRDIKPENIIITPEGATKLTDLGLAISQD